MAPRKTAAKPIKTNLTPSANKDDVLVELNLESFLTPVAIFIGALMISFSILYSVGKLSTVNTATNTDTTDTTADQYPETTTSIDDDPILGDKKTAKVAIVEFSDYECPYCKQHFTETHSQLVKDYIDTGKAILVFRDFPLSFHDPMATNESNAANCVNEFGGSADYWKFHDVLFTNTTSNGTGLTMDQVNGYAKDLGLDSAKFKDCVANLKYKDEIKADITDGSTAGVDGTPGFIVGVLKKDGTVDGVKISGAQDYTVFQKFLDEQIAKAS
jgi:protein-disulfide isomerase